MKKFLLFLAVCAFLASCKNKPEQAQPFASDEMEAQDSTLYGTCGAGTMMNTLQLVTNMEDTLLISLLDAESDEPTLVAGGLMSGDRMAVTARKTDGEWTAQRVININSLLGRWTSIDKSFQITDDGEVLSDVKAESKAWTQWRILNGQLLLNRDTFDILTLDADSLELENRHGIFAFQRLRAKKASAADNQSNTQKP